MPLSPDLDLLCRCEPTRPVDDKELWRLYREAYNAEPFVRIVRDRAGRLLGVEVDRATGRVLDVEDEQDDDDEVDEG